MRVRLIVSTLTIILVVQCGPPDEYRMPSLMGGEDYVDVTEYIREKGYEPIYCGADSNLCALIDPNPKFNIKDEDTVFRSHLKKWGKNEKPNLDLNLIDSVNIEELTNYQYTYFLIEDPIDVYSIEITAEGDTLSSFFRMKNGKLMLPFKEDGWVHY